MRIMIFILSLVLSSQSYAKHKNEPVSFLLLGDIHYDLPEDHDMDWLQTKPDDWRQVTTEYTQFTKNNWIPFTGIIRKTMKSNRPPIKAVLQMGDLSEGLAGSPQKAEQMANSAFSAIEKIGLKVPFILTKGNHDITGPGAKEAFGKVYLPRMAKLAGHSALTSANYSTLVDDVLFVCYDPWDKSTDGLHTLDSLLSTSPASYKFVMLHEPVIPVNERCWHIFRQDNQKREQLLRIIASHQAIVLCAHLHLYSVVRRDTQWGPIVQILVNSVVKDKNTLTPKTVITQYDTSLVTSQPKWKPETTQQRSQWIAAEAPHIKYYKQADLPGYGILSIDKAKSKIELKYYAAFGQDPYDVVNISEILNQ